MNIEVNKTHNMKCEDGLELLNADSVDLVIHDAPYFSTNIKEVGDNQWKTQEDYVDWCLDIIKQTEKVLKSNGSFYWFHNDINIMVDILYRIKNETDFVLKNQIVWDKFPTHDNFSRVIKTYGSNRKYGQTFSEYVYYFTLQDEYLDTPFSRIMKDKMEELDISQKDISKLQLSKNGNMTGWVHNKLNCGQLPTREQWELICKLFNISNDFDELIERYNEERYCFNQPFIDFKGASIEKQKELIRPYSNIWNYNKDKQAYKTHMTPKPVSMIEHIIKTSSRPGSVILDGFMGSGTTAVATINVGENRKFIGFEMNETFCELSETRVSK